MMPSLSVFRLFNCAKVLNPGGGRDEALRPGRGVLVGAHPEGLQWWLSLRPSGPACQHLSWVL